MERPLGIRETHQSGSSSVAPEPVESLVKIDSISIDLINADDNGNGKCEHFSIRGFASNMRSKDWKKCWPFALDGACNISEEQNCKLPPLLVPKFRWWCCQNCLQEIGAGGSANEKRTVAYNNSKLKSFCTCPHVSSNGDAATWLSDLQQAPKINVESRKHDANTCLNVNSNECDPLFSDKSKKKAEIANVPIIGKKDVLENNINKEIHLANYPGIDDISSLLQQTLLIDDKVASLRLRKPALKDNEIDAIKHPNTDSNCRVKDTTELPQNGKHAPSCDQQMELVKAFGSNGIASMVNSIPDSVKTHTDHPSLKSDDCEYASSESAEISVGTASGSSHRRKTRKVRLLTELLGKNGDEKTDLMSTEGSPSGVLPDAATGRDSISAPLGQVTFQGNVTSSLGHSRKRRQDEEWRPSETSSPNSGHKNLRTCRRVEETTDKIASSDSEGTVDGSGTQTDAKNYLVNIKVDRAPIIRKKKSKRAQTFDKFLSLSLSRENLQKKLGNTSKGNATDIVLYKSNAGPTCSGLDPLAEPPRKAEKKSNLLKKKSKINKDHDGHVSPIAQNNGVFREGLNSRRDVEIRQSASAAVVLNLIQDASAGKGLHFSLNNCLPDKRYEGKYISPIRDGAPSVLPWQGGVLGEDHIGRKDLKRNYVGDPSFSSKPELGAYIWKGMHFDLNSDQATYRVPFLKEKQMHSSCTEVGSHSLIQQLDYSGTSNNGKTVELQEHQPVARKHYDQRAEMVSEQGTLDDIPMEIVELMAKNQYERCLPDTEVNKQLSETNNTVRNHQRVDLNKVYQNEETNLFHETSLNPKPRAKNGRTGKIVRGDDEESSRQKSFDYFSHIDQNQDKMSQLEQSYFPAGFRPFPICGDKQLNGIQFSLTNSSRQNSAKNCQWIGNMVGQRSSHPNVQALGVCNTCQSAPQPTKEAAHLWPSMIPNNVPYAYGIPQKCADQVVKVDVLSNCPNSLPKGNICGNEDQNFLNLTSNFEKHGRKFDSEAFRRTNTDYSFACKHNGMGSLDMYSNETIPAMHLLSLMDAGLQSGSPVDVDVDGNRRFSKKASFLHDHHCKEFSNQPSGEYRGNSMKHLSYDCYNKNHLPEKYCECVSAIPTAGPSTSSFQHEKSFKKTTDFMDQFSLKSRDKEKKKSSNSQRQNRNHRSRKAVSSTSGLNTTCGSIPVHSMPKLVLGSSDFRMFPIQFQSPESATKHNQNTRIMNATLFHPRSGSVNEICSINRNPADFTVPEAGNIYMIGGEELKFGRKTPSSGLVKLGGHKRQRKVSVRKEHSRQGKY